MIRSVAAMVAAGWLLLAAFGADKGGGVSIHAGGVSAPVPPNQSGGIARYGGATMVDLKDIVNVVCVNSYDPDHICEGPQNQGFREVIADFNELSRQSVSVTPGRMPVKAWRLSIVSFYMYANTRNIGSQSIDIVASKILAQPIAKNPDFFMCFDDVAFKTVGIQAMKAGNFCMFSGLNKPIAEYHEAEGFDLSMCAGVEEPVDLSRLAGIFKQIDFSPDFHIIAEAVNPTDTGRILKDVYQAQIKKHFPAAKISIIQVRTETDLSNAIRALNDAPRGVIVPVAQRIWSERAGGYVSGDRIGQVIVNLNRRQIELGINDSYVAQGFALSVGPDFHGMGYLAGKMIIRFLFVRTKFHSVESPKSITAVNARRMRELSIAEMFDGVRFDKTYAWY